LSNNTGDGCYAHNCCYGERRPSCHALGPLELKHLLLQVATVQVLIFSKKALGIKSCGFVALLILLKRLWTTVSTLLPHLGGYC
jgi:hypothetical protein